MKMMISDIQDYHPKQAAAEKHIKITSESRETFPATYAGSNKTIMSVKVDPRRDNYSIYAKPS
jgi:hypothetical protein